MENNNKIKDEEVKWYKVPKSLHFSSEYVSLKPASKVLYQNLLHLYNSYEGEPFFQTNKNLMKYTGLSEKKLQSAKKELNKKFVIMERKGNIWWYNVSESYKKYTAIMITDDETKQKIIFN
jgi:hypothetical protein